MPQQSTPAERAAATIRGAVRAQKRTHEDLGRQLGVCASAAGNRLRGETPFTLNELDEVAAWLDLDPTGLAAAIYAEPARTPHPA